MQKKGLKWYSEKDKKQWIDQNPFPSDAIRIPSSDYNFKNPEVFITLEGDLAVKMTQDTWFLMDNNDTSLSLLSMYRWNFCKGYAQAIIRNSESGGISIKRMHCEVLSRHASRPITRTRLVVDHKNGNTLDNRLSNLRWATASQNSFNRRLTGTTSNTGYRNISWSDKQNAYLVNMTKPDPIESELPEKVVSKRFSVFKYGTREAAFIAAFECVKDILSSPDISDIIKDRT